MSSLLHRAIKYLQVKFPHAVVLHENVNFNTPSGETFPAFSLVAVDVDSGVRQSLFAISNFGAHGENEAAVAAIQSHFLKLKSSVEISGGNGKGHMLDHHEFVDSPKLLIYSDNLLMGREAILGLFARCGCNVDIVAESELYRSAFISYGGPDLKVANAINRLLKECGVKTFLFENDSLPGEKLHRIMWKGVENYERVVLICSRSSLDRPGVQNEIERVLEREAREGGTSILIPISIDTYVFDQWNPERADIAQQVRSRMIATFPSSPRRTKKFLLAGDRLLQALKR